MDPPGVQPVADQLQSVQHRLALGDGDALVVHHKDLVPVVRGQHHGGLAGVGEAAGHGDVDDLVIAVQQLVPQSGHVPGGGLGGGDVGILSHVDTLKYLKKGGRVTAAGAAIGTVLGIKPVLQIQGEKLDAFAKARGWKSAKKIMLDAMERDLTERFAGKEVHLGAAYTCSDEEAQAWKQEIQERFPGNESREMYKNLLRRFCREIRGPHGRIPAGEQENTS